MRNESYLRRAGWFGLVVLALVAGRVVHAHEPLQRLIVKPASGDGGPHAIVFVAGDNQDQDGEKENVDEDVLILRNPEGDARRIVLNLLEEPGDEEEADGYWLGLLCRPSVEESLRAHLELPEGRGLQVLEVVRDSPAAEAGLKKYDILLSVGAEVELNDLRTLVDAVKAAGGDKLKLRTVRGGKRLTVEVRPAKRPRANVAWAPNFDELKRAPGGDWVPRVLREFESKRGPGNMVITRFLGPGVVFPPHAEFPDDLEVTIHKKGKAPAKIVVRRGDDRWETTTDKLGELPDDVRGHVEPMLGRWPMTGRVRFRPDVRVRPESRDEDVTVEIERPENIIIEVPEADEEGEGGKRIERRRIIRHVQPQVRQRSGDDGYERRFRQMDERLERLQGLIERLHDRVLRDVDDEEEEDVEREDGNDDEDID